MKIALFRCCPTNTLLKQYETSTDAVLQELGISFIDVPAFACCGYPLKNIDFKASILASARNLAIAEDHKVVMLTVCSCCFGNLKHAQQLLQEDIALKDEINAALKKEGLRYNGDGRVMHLFEVLFQLVGLDAIRAKFTRTFNRDLKVAVHYGCHLLRPSRTVQLDNPMTPFLFEQLVEATGAASIEWPASMDCCGSPILGVFDELSMTLTGKKVANALESGADYICVACPYCQMQFDGVQQKLSARGDLSPSIPSILFTQLIGICLGIEDRKLGLDRHKIEIGSVMQFIKQINRP